MQAPTIVIEEIADGVEPEVIALAAVDAASCRAVSTLCSSDQIRFVPAVHPRARAHTALDRSPAMVVVVGDGRVDGCVRTLIGLRQNGALTVAVVAVESLKALAAMAPLARVFDAVLPVVVPRAVDAEMPLARALAAVTAFATADAISLPVDEVYPFFVAGGQLTCGAAEGDDVAAAAASALAEARLGEAARGVRMLLHVETTQNDLRRDLDLASQAIHRRQRLDDFWLTVSVSGGLRKGVSIVAAAARVGGGRGAL